MKKKTPGHRSLFFIAAFTLMLSGVSCKKIKELFTFTISTENNITIGNSSPVNIPVDIITPEVTTNSSQQFENNNTNINLVKDIRLKSLDLDIISPAGKTFSFLQSIHIYISTNAGNEIELASLDNIPATATSISLISTNAKLDEYVKAEHYSLRTKVVLKQVFTQSVEIKNNCKFTVTANL